jgi:hypothetical protein
MDTQVDSIVYLTTVNDYDDFLKARQSLFKINCKINIDGIFLK